MFMSYAICLNDQVLAMVPPWTRIYRIQRDIPMPLVTSGVDHGNLRELAGTVPRASCRSCKPLYCPILCSLVPFL